MELNVKTLGSVINFAKPEDMYDLLHDKVELYNHKLHLYVFEYNKTGALANCTIFDDQLKELVKISKSSGEKWRNILSYCILLADSRYDPLDPRFIALSHSFCEKYYNQGDWIVLNSKIED